MLFAQGAEMKRLLPALAVLSLTAASLAGCTTPTVYQQAASPDAVGYSEYRIEPGRYRIMFRGGTDASPELVMDYALIRAADLALAEGYDWFQVSDRYVRGVGAGYGSSISFGVGGASYGHHSATGVGVGTGFDLGGGGALAATIEVVMGHGKRPEGLDAYDAREVRRTLGRPA